MKKVIVNYETNVIHFRLSDWTSLKVSIDKDSIITQFKLLYGLFDSTSRDIGVFNVRLGYIINSAFNRDNRFVNCIRDIIDNRNAIIDHVNLLGNSEDSSYIINYFYLNGEELMKPKITNV